MKRGGLASVTMQDRYSAARPALTNQSDLYPPVSVLQGTPLFRVPVEPDGSNGLRNVSEVMVDKLQTLSREKIGDVLGHMADDDMLAINRTLAVFLGVV